MRFFQKKRKTLLIVLTVVCILLSIITALYKTDILPVRDWIAYLTTPIQKKINEASNWTRDKIEFYKTSYEIYEENKKLKEQIGELIMENRRLAQFEYENEALSELLKTAKLYPQFPTQGADVIGRNPNNWYKTLMINKGENENILQNMVVINSGALLGRVFEVGGNFSHVLTIIDDRSSVSVVTPRSDEIAILKGDYSLKDEKLCRMAYINKDVDIFVGDEVYTSDTSEVYPPGLYIGVIKEIKYDSIDQSRYATVEVVIDYKNIDKLLIIDELYGTD